MYHSILDLRQQKRRETAHKSSPANLIFKDLKGDNPPPLQHYDLMTMEHDIEEKKERELEKRIFKNRSSNMIDAAGHLTA